MPRMKTIRQVAAMGILSEHYLRLRLKQGMLPGIFVGSRFLVNVDELTEQLKAESRANLKQQDGQ